MTTQEEIKVLKEEIERLKDMLRANGIPVLEKEAAGHLPLSQEPLGKKSQFSSNLSLQEKVTLFQSLFKGREDIFARRWFSNKTGKSGYQPVGLNE